VKKKKGGGKMLYEKFDWDNLEYLDEGYSDLEDK